MGVELKFNSLEDFDPARVAQQVPALRALLETRAKLRDLMSKADRSEELEGLLEQVLKNEGDLKSLQDQLGLGQAGGLIHVGSTDRRPGAPPPKPPKACRSSTRSSPPPSRPRRTRRRTW